MPVLKSVSFTPQTTCFRPSISAEAHLVLWIWTGSLLDLIDITIRPDGSVFHRGLTRCLRTMPGTFSSPIDMDSDLRA